MFEGSFYVSPKHTIKRRGIAPLLRLKKLEKDGNSEAIIVQSWEPMDLDLPVILSVAIYFLGPGRSNLRKSAG